VAIAIVELPDGITQISLDGSLDIAGAAAIDLRMNIVGGFAKCVLVDLRHVVFIGSMGLRSLVSPARAILARGGKMVLFGPNDLVEKVLRTSGIDSMLPIFHDYRAALDSFQ
jgi:anti-anti-sigma factor